jgi:hypothetical protein
MAMSAAERQRKYRQKVRSESKLARLSLLIEMDAWVALKLLSQWSEQTRTEFLRSLLLETQSKLVNQIRGNQKAWDRYWEYDRPRPKRDKKKVSQKESV